MALVATGPASRAFVLDENAPYTLDAAERFEYRWMEPAHLADRERALVLLAGESLWTDFLVASAEPVLWCRFAPALPKISTDGLDVHIELLMADGSTRTASVTHIANAAPNVVELAMSLPVAAGEVFRVRLACGAGPEQRPEADWLGVCSLVVADRAELSRWRARSQHAWRLRNEIAHFESVYQGSFYADRHRQPRSGATASEARMLPVANSSAFDGRQDQLRRKLLARAGAIAPQPGENAFAFAHRVLLALLPIDPPDFAARLRALSREPDSRPVRMLALCAGEAAIEAGILDQAGVAVELCIVDVNEHLVTRAAAGMPSCVTVDAVVGDVNALADQLGTFDVVVITSGLHHIVELEAVLSSIANMLERGGEFWLIGEQVGRNGNRLWPEARVIADAIFREWPAGRRYNHNTGVEDPVLPDRDFSSGCFEGIRSQEILDQVERYFLPLEVFLHDAFLWRLVDVAYAANFDPMLAIDRECLIKAAVEEAMHWGNGGRGTSLHAAYRSKQAAMADGWSG